MAQASYEVEGIAFGVRTTSRAFAAWLDETLAAHKIDEDLDCYYSVVVADEDAGANVRGFHILYKTSTTLARSLHLPTVAEVLLADIEALTYPTRRDAIYLNAVPAFSNGSVALIPAQWGSYLSEQARRDRKAGIAMPVEAAVAVDPDTGQIIPAPPTLELAPGHLERLVAAIPSRGRPERRRLDHPRSVDVAVTNVRGSGKALIEPMTRGQMLHRLAGSVVNLDAMGAEALTGIKRLVEQTRCVGVPGGSPEQILGSLNLAFESNHALPVV